MVDPCCVGVVSIRFRLRLDDADLDVVAHALEKDLSLEGDHLALLGCFEGSDQGLVVVRYLLVVEELPEGGVRLPFYADPADVDQQLGALLVEPVLLSLRGAGRQEFEKNKYAGRVCIYMCVRECLCVCNVDLLQQVRARLSIHFYSNINAVQYARAMPADTLRYVRRIPITRIPIEKYCS